MANQYRPTTYREFVEDYNISNNDVLNEANLNRAVNRLKKELDQTFAVTQILQEKKIQLWDPTTRYEPGEVVLWPGVENMDRLDDPEFIKTKYYVASHSPENINRGITPGASQDQRDTWWTSVTKDDIIPGFDISKCVKYNSEDNKNEHGTSLFRLEHRNDAANVGFVRDTVESEKQRAENEYVSKTKSEKTPFNQPESTAKKKHLDYILDKLNFGRKFSDDAELVDGVTGGIINGSETPDYPPKVYVRTYKKNTPDEIKYVEAAGAHLFNNYDHTKYVEWTAEGSNTIQTPKDARSINIQVPLVPSNPGIDLGSNDKSFGTVHADTFTGTAHRALYADLAEKFETDSKYEFGTVLGFKIEGKKAIGTEFKTGMKLLGVVAENPSYLMNSGVDGLPITVKGLIPVRVEGPYELLDYVLADDNGKAIAKKSYTFEETSRLIGIIVDISGDLPIVKV